MTDKTGTGAVVFQVAPTFINPIVTTQSAGDNSTKAASTAYVDAAVGNAAIANRTALKALDTTIVTRAVLVESGREGTFVWKTGNYSSNISTDTQEGVYIKATAVASSSGAWVRIGDTWSYNVKWFGATGDGTTDDYLSIQTAITLAITLGTVKIIFFPTGSYYVGTGLVVSSSVKLLGSGRDFTVVESKTAAINTVTFSGGNYCGLEAISIYGDQRTTVTTTYPVVVNANISVIFRDVNIWGGFYALKTAGVDGRHTDCFISGMGATGGCVFSTGANFWTDCKFDDYAGQSHSYSFWQASSSSVMENQFVDCDFAANSTYAIVILDPVSQLSRSKFIGCVIGLPIDVSRSEWTLFDGCEFGGGTGFFTIDAFASVVTIANCYAGTSCTATGAGTMLKSNNFNVT